MAAAARGATAVRPIKSTCASLRAWRGVAPCLPPSLFPSLPRSLPPRCRRGSRARERRVRPAAPVCFSHLLGGSAALLNVHHVPADMLANESKMKNVDERCFVQSSIVLQTYPCHLNLILANVSIEINPLSALFVKNQHSRRRPPPSGLFVFARFVCSSTRRPFVRWRPSRRSSQVIAVSP